MAKRICIMIDDSNYKAIKKLQGENIINWPDEKASFSSTLNEVLAKGLKMK